MAGYSNESSRNNVIVVGSGVEVRRKSVSGAAPALLTSQRNLATEAINASINALPIIKLARQLNDDELRDRLKGQWKFIILTAAFLAGVAVAFLVANEPPENTNKNLWEIFKTINAASFLSLVVVVAQCTCFLTTLMMCPPGKTQEALHKLRFVEPLPSILLVLAMLAFTASVPIYMILMFGNADSTFAVHIITGALGALGILVFLWTMHVQRSLLHDDDVKIIAPASSARSNTSNLVPESKWRQRRSPPEQHQRPQSPVPQQQQAQTPMQKRGSQLRRGKDEETADVETPSNTDTNTNTNTSSSFFSFLG
ncbi:hypothetical protein ACA910_017940 [Epithemia clementina (nom. ined.)]